MRARRGRQSRWFARRPRSALAIPNATSSPGRACCGLPSLRRPLARPRALSRCWRSGIPRIPRAIQTHYVDVFDLSRKHSLYLSYWTDGDTRRRGEVLAAFKQRYRRSGFLVDTWGELPDYLPMVLEYAAIVDPVDGTALLQEYRSSVELLRLALAERGTPYAGVLTAVCSTLPGPSPADRKAVMAMAAAGPPTEMVGLEPKDPRLLPMGGSR